MEKEFWGQVEGADVYLFTLQNDFMKVSITNYGATLVGLWVKDKVGVFRDVLLGYDTLDDYRNGTSYFGALVGRCANRIHGDVTIDGKKWVLQKNEGDNCLHSGAFSTAFRVWDVVESDDEKSLSLTLRDEEKPGGLPGNVEFSLRYSLLSNGALSICVDGRSDAKTLLNVTSHGYFNLDGHDAGKATKQQVRIWADRYTPVSAKTNSPSGECLPVEGTVFDFRKMRTITENVYDHNYLLNQALDDQYKELRKAAEAYSEASGIFMKMYTNCPCMQFYTGKWIPVHRGKRNAEYGPFQGFCFEPQFTPDAIHLEGFEVPLYEKNQPYQFQMVLEFHRT